MRNRTRALTELLLTLALTAIATTIGVLILTHPQQFEIRNTGVPLEGFAIVASFAVYGMLESLTDRLWNRYAPEPDADEADA